MKGRTASGLHGATAIGLSAALLLLLPPLTGMSNKSFAQCAARTQTGIGSSAVALAQRCGTTVGDLRRANPGSDLSGPGLLNIPGGRTSVVPDSLNNDIAPAPPAIRATRQRPIVRPAPTFRQQGAAPLRRSSLDAGSAGSYSIRPSDTLSRIAASSGVGVQALIGANRGIQPNRLAVGQTIRIPTR